MFSDEHYKRMSAFNERVLEIQHKYEEQLKSIIPDFNPQKINNLNGDFLIKFPPPYYQIGFRNDTIIPQHIQGEITDAFISIFSVQ